MNRLNNEQDMFTVYVNDRRHLLKQIEMYELFSQELGSEMPDLPAVYRRAIAIVIRNYLLLELKRELQVSIFIS